MIDWELLYKKFGQKKSAEKFEDLALEYVRNTYSEYKWKATSRTRDGNRDFHNLENDLLKIWGEAKYKKNSISLTRKDLDPTILSGLIDGTVELIIFVSNGKIPDSLITRMILGANMKGIKLSFIMGQQLSDWLLLNPNIYKTYFEEDIPEGEIQNNQLLEIKRISFYEPISLDFSPNFGKVNMNVDDIFIMSCLIMNTKNAIGKIELEGEAPIDFVNSDAYYDHNEFEMKPGLNVFSFLVKANCEYNSTLRINLQYNECKYFYVTNKIVIKENHQLNIYYFEQLNILKKIKRIIDSFSSNLGNYLFFIQGNSGMGKSYILNQLSLDYCLNNDLTLVTFENDQNSNENYLLLCRVIIFLLFGNIFWDFNESNIKKFCIMVNSTNNYMNVRTLNSILDGCFDANIAKTSILSFIDGNKEHFPRLITFKPLKHHKILLLDDLQYLSVEQGRVLKIIIDQQINSRNNNIIIFAGRKNEFNDLSLEKKLLESVSNYYELKQLSPADKEGTILQNFTLKEKQVSTAIVEELPSNVLILNELLSNLKYSFDSSQEVSNVTLTDYYIKIYNDEMIFQEKFASLAEQYYLLDIIYLFKKGIRERYLFEYPLYNNNSLKKDLEILYRKNCIKNTAGLVLPYHDYVVENYRKIRKGKNTVPLLLIF